MTSIVRVSSWWLDEEAAPALARVRVDAPEFEIVGAGITGISAALTLAEAGRRVRVHDAREVAGGASGRNGGFALRGGAMPYDQAREWLGRDNALEYWRLTEQYLDRLAALAGDALRRTGSLRIAADDEERDEIRAECEALWEDGIAAEWRTDVLDGRFPAAIFHPGDAAIQPARLVRRLAARAAEAGVEIVEHHRVESIDELEAPQVLIATDGYPSGLLGELEGLIIPTRGQMIATEPIEERLFDCPHYGRHGFDYWQQLPDGRITAAASGTSRWTPSSPTPRRRRRPSRARWSRSSPTWSAVPSRWRSAGRASSGSCSTSCRWSGGSRDLVALSHKLLGGGRVLGPRERPRLHVRRPRRQGDARRRASAPRTVHAREAGGRGVTVERRTDDRLFPPPGYAHVARAAGTTVYTAGAVPLDAEGVLIRPGDVAAQTRR